MKSLLFTLLLIPALVGAETIWVTKYALTRGIQKFDNAQVLAGGKVAIVGDAPFRNGEFYLTEQAARERAETLRNARIAAMLRELERLKAVK